MNLIYLKKFNNYYNRRIKFYDDYQSYLENSDDYLLNAGVDFNGNDGVSTIKTANLEIDFNPDYMLVLSEDDSHIVSRWFVLEMKRQRNGQYSINLRRDVIADHYNQLIDAPIFIHKGNVDADNPLLFNKEGFICNQVKTKEIILKEYENDEPWIVGYIGNDAFDDGNVTVTVPDPTATTMNIAELPIKLNDNLDPTKGATLSTFKRCILGFNYVLSRQFDALYRHLYTNFSYDTGFTNSTIADATWSARPRAVLFRDTNATEIKNAFTDSIDVFNNSLLNGIETYLDGVDQIVASSSEASLVQQLNGKVFYSAITGKFYQLSITGNQSTTSRTANFAYNSDPHASNPDYLTSLSAAMEAVIDNMKTTMTDATVEKLIPEKSDRDVFYMEYTLTVRDINFVEVTPSASIDVELTAGHNLLNDAPYSMFAMPFNLSNLSLASRMAADLSTFIYDIQILPYCPARELLNPEGTDVVNTAVDGRDYNRIKNGDDQNVSFILWATSSSGTFNIYQSIEINTSNPIELKASNECDIYRLVSPNYNGAFEFSAAMNLGVDHFEVSYTYKPYSPFIQVNPAFKNLYGSDFNDARGLICNGNFSIATLTDQWKTYEINNKNYENIFNVQIKTMDKNNSLNVISQSIANPLNSLSTGIGIGGITGSPIAGAAAGAASLVAGGVDIAIGQSVYQNNRQLQKDMFQMNLQNIHARPDTLNKISAYNINNKYFPFVEYYTCTDVEKEAFRNKIKYEGMTLGVIGTLREFINEENNYNFFKGSPVIMESIEEDYHIADAIAVELEKGVYI